MVDRDARPSLELVPRLVEEVDDLRHLAEDIQQLAQRDPRQPLGLDLANRSQSERSASSIPMISRPSCCQAPK